MVRDNNFAGSSSFSLAIVASTIFTITSSVNAQCDKTPTARIIYPGAFQLQTDKGLYAQVYTNTSNTDSANAEILFTSASNIPHNFTYVSDHTAIQSAESDLPHFSSTPWKAGQPLALTPASNVPSNLVGNLILADTLNCDGTVKETFLGAGPKVADANWKEGWFVCEVYGEGSGAWKLHVLGEEAVPAGCEKTSLKVTG